MTRPRSRRRTGCGYRAFDLTEARPERIEEMFGELLGLFEGGVLAPLPVTCGTCGAQPEAFRYMSQARHIGKIVLSIAVPAGAGGQRPGHRAARRAGRSWWHGIW